MIPLRSAIVFSALLCFLLSSCKLETNSEKNKSKPSGQVDQDNVEDPASGVEAGDEGSESGDSGKDSNKEGEKPIVSIVGQLALGFETLNVDTSMAVPLGITGGQPLTGAVVSPITAGQVALEIPTGAGLSLQQNNQQNNQQSSNDWAVALIDSSKTEKIEQIVGFLGLDSGADSMMNLPIGDVKGNGLDFGDISLSEGSAISSTSITDQADKFAVEVEMLNEIASTDNVTRGLKNIIANTSADGSVFYQVTPFFIYRSLMDTAKNQFSDLSTMKFAPTGAGDRSDFTYGFYFKAQDPARATFDQICNGQRTIAFAPPADLVKNSVTYNAANPLTSTGVVKTVNGNQVQCAVGEFYMSGSMGQASFGFNFGGGGYDGAVLPGYWRMKVDTQEVAVFDLGAYSPVGSDGKPLVYVPSVNITVDPSTNKIDKIEVKFYYWDRNTAVFKEVSDFSVFDRTVSKLKLAIIDNDGINNGCSGNRIEELINLPKPSTGSTFSVSQFGSGKWRYSGDVSGTEKVANDIGVSYEIAGMAVTFTLLASDDGC
jgi:hypothetical protein